MRPRLGIKPDWVGNAKLPDKRQSGKIEKAIFRALEAWLGDKLGVKFGQHGRSCLPMRQRCLRIKAAGIFVAIEMGLEGAVQRGQKCAHAL